MAFTVEADFDRTFEVNCPFDVVFDLLADVPRSASHYPTLEHLEPLGENEYRWELQKIGIQQYYIQTIYGNRYKSDRESGRITWEPIEDVGNAIIEGYWEITPIDDHRTRVHFHTHGKIKLPLPSLLKLILTPLILAEFSNQVDKYIENLKKTFTELCEEE